jgi:hypothetical protein
VQQSLFDEANLAEISHPDYPGERLITCRNPALARKRAHKRLELLAATEADLTIIKAAVTAGRLKPAGKIGVRVGKVLGRFNMANTSTRSSTTGGSRSPATGQTSTPKQPWTASTSPHLRPDTSMDAATVVEH